MIMNRFPKRKNNDLPFPGRAKRVKPFREGVPGTAPLTQIKRLLAAEMTKQVSAKLNHLPASAIPLQSAAHNEGINK